MGSQTIWGIHAGKGGEAHALFLKKNVVALGFTAMGRRLAPSHLWTNLWTDPRPSK